MRISVISAAVCCAVFSVNSVHAASLTIEQRLAILEAKVNNAEREAKEAKLQTQRAEARAAHAEQQLQQLTARTTASEHKIQETAQLAKSSPWTGLNLTPMRVLACLLIIMAKADAAAPAFRPPVR